MKIKIVSSLLVVAMVCVSFSIAGSFTVKANFFDTMSVPWSSPFTPKDAAWDDQGRYLVVVGQQLSAGANGYLYISSNKTWWPLSSPANMQVLNGVCWDHGLYQRFWIAASTFSAQPTTYYLTAPDTTLQSPSGFTTSQYDAVACDHVGSPLFVGFKLSTGGARYYNMTSGSWTNLGTVNSTGNIDFRGITYNNNDNRFYSVGNDTSGMGTGTSWYTDVAPLNSGSHIYRDTTPIFATDYELYSIDWNQVYNYGLAVGKNGTYKVDSYWIGTSLNWTILERGQGNMYRDVCWDQDGYNQAAIVGQNAAGSDRYWRYYHTTNTIVLSYSSATINQWNCVAIKPPASPKWVFIPAAMSGIIFNIMEKDQGTNVVLNAAFPHIFFIDFRQATTGLSRLNWQVDVDSIYTFVVEANYSIGGVPSWNNADLNITAWYDNGIPGFGSNPDPNWGAVNNRTRQFSMVVDGVTGATVMTYPVGAPLINEFSFVDSQVRPSIGDHYFVYVNVSFRAQTWAANGNSFANGGATLGNIWGKNSALNDMNSWDFCVSVYDQTNTGAANNSYEEFGVNRAVSIAVSGNPTGNAPPGTNGVVMANPSIITYTANTNYTVNVSINNLLLNGIGPQFIGATNLSVANSHPNATNLYSELNGSAFPTGRNFTAPGVDWLVWGNTSNPGAPGPWDELNPPYNGTFSAGPWVSNYNTPANYTTYVNWWANVPAGIPEGMYWSIITYTIWNP